MRCEELSLEYGAYALGIAEDPERSEIAEHLARQCPACTAGVKSALALVSSLSGAVTPVDPPRRLRKKIVGMVSPEGDVPEEKRSGIPFFIPWAISAALAIALLAVALPGFLHPQPEKSKLEEALSILNDPVTKDVTFGEPTARGRVFVSSGKGVVLIAAHLPPLAENQTFELWVIPAAGNPIPAGTFRGNDDSSAIYVRPGPVNSAAAVAVTVEPKGGSPQPTTKPFIVSKL